MSVKLSFDVDKDILNAAKNLCDVLDYEIGNGIYVTAEKSEKTGVILEKDLWKYPRL